MNVNFDPREHKYTVGDKEYPSVTTILKHFNMLPDFERWGNDQSLDFGNAVHFLTQLYDLNNLGEYNPALEPYLNGYKRFLEVHEPKWEAIEEPMVSKVWQFAGTADRIGTMRKGAIVDLKTGSDAPYHALQTAGYQVLAEENTKLKIRERYTLILLPDDFRLIPHKSKSDKSIFLGLAQAYNFKKKHKLLEG